MTEERRRFRVRWLVAVPLTIALAGFAGILFAEYRVTSEIKKEEEKLLALGIDVRELPRNGNAYEDYKRILPDTPHAPQFNRQLLVELETAARKPYVAFLEQTPNSQPGMRFLSGLDNVEGFCHIWSYRSAEQHDWHTLNRLYEVLMRLREQHLVGGVDPWFFHFDDMPPMTHLAMSRDRRVREWLRRKIEKFDYRSLLRLKFSWIGRYIRRHQPQNVHVRYFVGMAPPASKQSPWWENAIRKTTIFRKHVDLVVLREWRKIAEQALSEPFEKVFFPDRHAQLINALRKDGSMPSLYAMERIGYFGNDGLNPTELHIALIQMDLMESKERGKPLVPTWSKKYCVDVLTGAPIIVKATPKDLRLSSKGSRGHWSRGTSW